MVACSAVSQAASPDTERAGSSGRGIEYTSYEANSWSCLFRQSGVKILVDPWLVDELTFAGQRWLYRGKKTHISPVDPEELAKGCDAVILSQGLPDHAHEPTLKRISKDTLVIASPAGAAVAQGLGFRNVRTLDHGQEMTLGDGKLRIKATVGALVGPPWAKRENGFLFTETADGGVSLYYEPHCDYDVQSLQGTDSVDIVITPGVNQELLSFPLVMGKDNVVGLLKRLKPKVFLPLVNAEFDSEGPLSSLISEKGNVAGLPAVLKAEGLKDIELVVPDPGKATSVVC